MTVSPPFSLGGTVSIATAKPYGAARPRHSALEFGNFLLGMLGLEWLHFGAAAADKLLDGMQPGFDAIDVGAILRGALRGLVGNQPAHPLLVLKPAPETDPDHGQDRDRKERFD